MYEPASDTSRAIEQTYLKSGCLVLSPTEDGRGGPFSLTEKGQALVALICSHSPDDLVQVWVEKPEEGGP